MYINDHRLLLKKEILLLNLCMLVFFRLFYLMYKFLINYCLILLFFCNLMVLAHRETIILEVSTCPEAEVFDLGVTLNPG